MAAPGRGWPDAKQISPLSEGAPQLDRLAALCTMQTIKEI